MSENIKNDMNLELAELEEVLKNKMIFTLFQAIVSLKNGEIIGYECLSRGPKDSVLYSPEKLFKVAEKHDRLLELDLLCRFKAIERLQGIDKNKLVFINVMLETFLKEKGEKDHTIKLLKRNNILPKNIILEINEKHSVEDYNEFNTALKNSRVKEYKLALDDIGSGHSRFKMILECKPNYIKIDKDLISNIDKDSTKQSIIKYVVLLANDTKMRVIAEGIENENELLTLIRLGVHAGQGYFLQRPESTLKIIPDSILEKIVNYNVSNNDWV